MFDRTRLAAAAEKERASCARFLRELCRIPAVSNEEGPVVRRVAAEMKKVGFDEIRIDGFGNILGRIGDGPRVIAMDSHLDAVGVGDPKEWKWDPYRGKFEKGVIWARGASDQRGGIAAMVYAGKLIKKLGLAADCTVWMVGSACEEAADGLSWLYILREKVIRPEFVIVSEPTNLHILRGHRGRMEIKVRIPGRSCHGAMPERGVNPITLAAPFIIEIARLNAALSRRALAGRGTIAVTQIREDGPSSCAVPGAVTLHLDRRMECDTGERIALDEVKKALKRAGVESGKAWVPEYRQPSWRGVVFPIRQYFPGWRLDSKHRAVRSAVATFKAVFGRAPAVGLSNYSTNATAIAGVRGVPAIVFGPGDVGNAHTIKERMPVDQLVAAMRFFAAFPTFYSRRERESGSR